MRQLKILILLVFISISLINISYSISWTSQPNPVVNGNYSDVEVVDLNFDGVYDIIGAKAYDEIKSSRDGLPIWYGQTYTLSNVWQWAISNNQFPTGPSASIPVPDPQNVGNGSMYVVRISNNCNFVSNWIVECISGVNICKEEKRNINGEPIHGNGDIDENTVELEEMYLGDGERWTFTFTDKDNFVVESSLKGAQNNQGRVDELYTSDFGELQLIIRRGSDDFESGDQIIITICLSRWKVYTEDRSIYLQYGDTNYFKTKEIAVDNVPLMALAIDSGDIDFERGDKFYFSVPDGPLTTRKYNDVEVFDVNLDGLKDLVGVGEGGIDVFKNTGPVLVNWEFVPVYTRGRNCIPSGEIVIDNINSVTARTEIISIIYDANTHQWNIYGDVSGYLGSFSSCPYQTLKGQFVIESLTIDGSNCLISDDAFYLSIKQTTWSGDLGPETPRDYISLAYGDLDKDGDSDLLTGLKSGGLEVWLNERDFTWTFGQAPPNSNYIFYDIELKDLNNDGNLDIIGATKDNGIKIWFGDGMLNWEEVEFESQLTTYYSVTVKDLNNDGMLDIIASPSTKGIDIWYQTSNGNWTQIGLASEPTPGRSNIGNGSMSEVNVVSDLIKNESWLVQCIEERPDGGVFRVVGSVSGEQQKKAYVNQLYTSDNGGIQFTISDGPTDFVVGDYFTFVTGKGPLAYELFYNIDAGDLNNDAKVDIFASSGDEKGLKIWSGNGVYGWNLETSPKDSSNFNRIFGSLDLNYDGNPDVIAASASNGGIQVWIGEDVDKFKFNNRWDMKVIRTGDFIGIATGDFNKDSQPDIVVTNYEDAKPGIWIWYGLKTGDFVLATAPEAPPKFYSVAVADFNRDGYDDIIAGHSSDGIYVWLNAQGGNWTEVEKPIDSGSFWGIDIADFNRDGKKDFIAVKDYDGTDSIVIMLGNGDGTFEESPFQITDFTNLDYWDVKTGDFDMNGCTDVIVSNYTGKGAYLWFLDYDEETGNYEFNRYIWFYNPEGYDHYYGIEVNDLNRDSISDFIITEDGHGASIFTTSGCGICPENWYFSPAAGPQSRKVDSGDFDNDGNPDFAFATISYGIYVYKNNFSGPGGNPSWAPWAQPIPNGDYIGLVVKDITQDKLPDIIATHYGQNGGIEAFISNRDFSMLKIAEVYPPEGGTFRLGEDEGFYFITNKELDRSTVSSRTIKVYEGERKVNVAIFVDRDNRKVTIIPDKTITTGSVLRVHIKGGYDGLLDIYGNPLDGNNNNVYEGSPSDDYEWSFSVIDLEPPLPPSDIQGVGIDHKIYLVWRPNTEPDLKGYWICWDTEPNKIPMASEYFFDKDNFGSNPGFIIGGVENNETYYVSLVTEDINGNYSAYSPALEITPQPLSPIILMAGYYNSYITASNGGNLTILAYVVDYQGDISKVELYYQGMPTGILLKDDGTQNDFAPNDGIYGFTTYVPAIGTPMNLLLEIVATDSQGNQSLVWPYYYSFDSGPFTPSAQACYWENNWKIKSLEYQIDFNSYSYNDYQQGTSPQIWMAGTMDYVNSYLGGGTFQLTAFVFDPDNDISEVQLYYAGNPTGVFLLDDGSQNDFAPSDNIYGLNVQIPNESLPVGQYVLEIVATDSQGNTSEIWPYLVIH